MIHKRAFANSLALVATLVYIVLYVLSLVAPSFFSFLLNAQVLGANIASLLPQPPGLIGFIELLAAIIIFSWIIGYFWAAFYNKMVR